MHILIHACPQRNSYVYNHLIPLLLAQGIKEHEINVWMDISHEGNLKSCINSFRACGLMDGGTWHLQDDVYPSKNFAKLAREHDEGVVCGFCNRIWDEYKDAVGIQTPEKSWYSFQCIRIPNKIAEEFAMWFLNDAKNRPAYKDQVQGNKNDDWFFKNFLIEKGINVFNLKPNIVEHIDYLIGGTTINQNRPNFHYGALYWNEGKPKIDD